MDYNNSSRGFRPRGWRVMPLSIKCDSLALRTESREEWIFSPIFLAATAPFPKSRASYFRYARFNTSALYHLRAWNKLIWHQRWSKRKSSSCILFRIYLLEMLLGDSGNDISETFPLKNFWGSMKPVWNAFVALTFLLVRTPPKTHAMPLRNKQHLP